jgi:hypothetical protein
MLASSLVTMASVFRFAASDTTPSPLPVVGTTASNDQQRRPLSEVDAGLTTQDLKSEVVLSLESVMGDSSLLLGSGSPAARSRGSKLGQTTQV